MPNPGMVARMDRDPPNPYRDMSLRELHQVMNERAGALLKGGQVSRRDLAYLLLAASWPLATGESTIGSPAHRVRAGASVVEAFLPEYERDARAVMHNTFQHAREAAGLTPEDTQRFTGLMRDRGTPIGWDTSTEAAFRTALEQLQAAKELKARNWAP